MFNSRIPNIKGTKKLLAKKLPVLSLGLPALDVILGGGLPVGSCILLEEDEFGIFAGIILKHYLAEGVMNEHSLLLASQDIDTKNIITTLPSPLVSKTQQKSESEKIDDQLRIAWRYQNLPNDKSSTNSAVFGHTYNSDRFIPDAKLKDLNIDHWIASKDNYSYEDLLTFAKEKVKDAKFNFNVPVENRTALRIAFFSLGSASWRGDIVKFLMKLRFLLRNTSACCVITIPANLIQDYVLLRCEHLCDAVIELKSLLNEENDAYGDYEGLLILKKLPVINAWCPTIPDSNDWAFKLKRKRFIIEKLHISPELKQKAHREGEDVSNDYEARKIISNIAQEF